MNYIIPTVNRPTLARTLASITCNDPNPAIFIASGGTAGENRNKCLSQICHDKKWIIFVDDDDFLIDGYIDELDDLFDIVIFRMYQSGVSVIPRYGNNKIVSGNVGINFAMKTDFFLKSGATFDNGGHGEDWRFMQQLLKFNPNIKITDEIMYIAPISNHLKK